MSIETPKYDFPHEEIELPSKGLIYPESNPLSSGKIIIKYPGAQQEDILSNTNYITDGTVLERYTKSLILSPINFDDLILGDQDKIMIAGRVLGNGEKYNITYDGKPYIINLSELEDKKLDPSIFVKGMKNEFEFKCPFTDNKLTWRILTQKDERLIKEEIKGLRKLNPEGSYQLSARLYYALTSVNGKSDTKSIREFIDKGHFISRDIKAFMKHVREIQPGVDLTFFPEGRDKAVNFPIGLDFFWSESE